MPAKTSFNDTLSTDYKIQAFTITNNGLEGVIYRILNNVSVAITPTIEPYQIIKCYPNTEAPADIEMSAVEISLEPGQNGAVTVTVHPSRC